MAQIKNLHSTEGVSQKKAINRNSIPWALVFITTILVAYGLLVVWSALQFNDNYSFQRQVMGVVMGVVIMIFFYKVDYHTLSDFTTFFLILNVILILSPHLPIIGVESKGAQSWINIGMRLQPGEFAKITVILLDASVLARYGGRLDDPREYMKALGIILIPFLCIMTQPDLGTGLVYLFIGAVTLVMGGARLKFLLITLASCIAAVAAVFAIDEVIKQIVGEYKLLKPYQRGRLLVFLDSSYDVSGDGYNLQQAKIAIGSGGFLGKSLLNATQSSLGFLPEAPTDFIFCVLAEQFGFVGSLLLLVLYACLLFATVGVARNADSLFGMLIVMGITGMWLFQILENIGMDIGLMPITGIPLPFMSYGSSFMLVNFALLGLIGSVYAHRTK